MSVVVRFIRRVLVVVLCLGASVLGSAGVASAHALLVSTNPAANAALPSSPESVVLTFSERVNVVDDAIRIVAGDGTPVATGAAHHDGGANTVAVDLPALADGTYVVAWKALSVESHPISGGFVFSVGAPGKVDPGLLEKVLNSGKPAQRDQVALGLGRALAYGGLALLVGGTAVAMWCAPARVPGRRVGRVLWAALAAGALGVLTMIAAQAATTAGAWTAWAGVASTDAGRRWFVGLGAFVGAAPLVALRQHFTAAWWRSSAALVGVVLLCATAAGGSALAGDTVVLGLVATVAHLAAMAVLVGCVVVAALPARDTPSDTPSTPRTPLASVAIGSLVVLAVTGAVNAWRESSSWSALSASNYGTWLLVKLAVVGVGVAGGVLAHRWAAAERIDGDERRRRRHGALALDAVVVVLALVASAGLVSSPPPAPPTPSAVVTVDVVQDGRIAQITLDPAVVGGTTMHVYITSATGSLQQPKKITVNALLPAQGLGPVDLPLQTAGPGHVTGSRVDFTFPGVWTINVVATYGDGDVTTFTTRMEVR